MSFTFDWPDFSDQFHYDAIQMLNTALNKGTKPPVMADKIEVVELQMGTQPPDLEIRDIGELTMDQFRGIFRFSYSGDAHIVLKTKVQANPLNHKQPDIHLMAGTRGMLAAKQPLVVPMLLRLSHFKLNSYVVLVVSKQKGITLVFKTDPLQNVDINSTFDSIAVIQKFIQREIEGQLRQMFREDLPGIIHRLSQQWIKAKVEAPYLLRHPPTSRRPVFETRSAPDLSIMPAASSIHNHFRDISSSVIKPRSVSGASAASVSRRQSSAASDRPSNSGVTQPALSFPDLENYDPTYGLRPEGLPTKSAFGDFSRLFAPNRGLADLTEENSDEGEEYGEDSFDIVDWDISDNVSTSRSLLDDVDDVIEFENIPAVGGGTVTRPRVYLSQSMVQPPREVGFARPASVSSRPTDHHLDPVHSAPILQRRHTNSINPATASKYTIEPHDPRADRSVRHESILSEPSVDLRRPPHRPSDRPDTPEGAENEHSQSSHDAHSVLTSQSSDVQPSDVAPIHTTFHEPRRRHSTSPDRFQSGSPPQYDMQEPNATIVLRPSLNNTIHQLSTLSHSNHTLSPYTRSFSHFTVRSVPPREPNPSRPSLPPDKQYTKAKRRRIYRIPGKPKTQPVQCSEAEVMSISGSPLLSLTPPSEFDASDLDRYFRSQEDSARDSPDSSFPAHVRRRTNQRQS